ncbi:MAG: T9SS type A sorting domain-containing protein [Bacteroidales bacterium]|nr:T9SS type A sorting domain-containing protein [Bacteroidales bacterium]
MRKFYLLLLTIFFSVVVAFAQPVKVGYFTYQKDMDPTAATVQLDPIIRMLKADPNLEVTVNVTSGTDTADLSGYDVVVVQESYSSSAAILTPKGALGLHTIPVPFVYNKTYALRNGRGLTGNAAGTGAETEGVGYFYLRVDAANQANDLFKGVTFDGDSVALFKVATNDAGLTVNPDRHKALNYTRQAVIVDAVTKDTLENTLLGVPAVINPAHTDITVCINDISAGTQISVDTVGNGQILQARMIALGMNFGAICGAYGTNITEAGLTIWRNAVYMAAGLAVPATPAEHAKRPNIGYFTYQKNMDATAASVNNDPIIRMLQSDPYVDVTVNVTSGTDTADLSAYDAVVVQESYSSSAAILTPNGALGLHTIPVPFVYNKTYAMRNGRGLTGNAAGTGAETEGDGNVYLRVDAANQSHELFSGIAFDGDSVALVKVTCNDAGVSVNPDRFKALNYARAAVIVDATTKDTIETTLLGKPAVINPAHTDITVSFNDIPAGTQISVDTVGNGQILQARMIALGMNFGAICGAYGTNITDAGLTLWRNAIYMAAGLPVADLPVAKYNKWKIGYFSLLDKVMVSTAAPVDADPIYTMLSEDNNQWDVELNLIAADSVFDLAAKGYDAVIVQESFNSGSAVFQPGGSLGLATFEVPFIYNKNYALRDGRGFTGGASGSGAELEGELRLKVLPENQTNPLFKGITFEEDSTVKLVRNGADDTGGTSRTKAMNFANNVKLTDTLGTRLALPAGVPETATVGTVSDIPAGDSIGSEKLNARMIVIGMNFGAICKDRGTNMSSAGLTLWRNAVHSALGLSIPATPVPALIPEVKAILVTDDALDDLQFNWLLKNGIMAEKLTLPAGKRLKSVAQDTIDMLNAADVVIIGRSNNSGDFGSSDSATRVTWNNLTVPTILNSQFIARSTRLNWFKSGTANQVNEAVIFEGKAADPADLIFAYSVFDADSISEWTYGADDYLSLNDTIQTNGTKVVFRENIPLVVRFDADVAFYEGAADTARGLRTYFGFGNDNAGPANYFNLTASAQAAYLGEIMRITGNPVVEPIYYVSADASMKLITSYPAISPAFSADVLEYQVLAPEGTEFVEFTAVANHALATVTGPDTVWITQDTTVVSFFATAENLWKGPVYKVTIILEGTGFEDASVAGISLFPNPAFDNLTIDGLKGNTTISIMNTVGQLVYNRVINDSKAMINISSFRNGLYIIQLEMNGEIVTTKFIKQ